MSVPVVQSCVYHITCDEQYSHQGGCFFSVFARHFSVRKIANKIMNLTAKFLKVISYRSHFRNRL